MKLYKLSVLSGSLFKVHFTNSIANDRSKSTNCEILREISPNNGESSEPVSGVYSKIAAVEEDR